MNKRFLGVIQGANPKGYIIVKSTGSNEIRVGVRVFDKGKRILGTIKRIFGPVKAPYLSIKPKKHGIGSVVAGSEVYIEN